MKSKRAIKIFTWVSVGIVVLASGVWLGLGQVSGSIKRIDVFGKLTNRPDRVSTAVNYLVVGSDTRIGLTKAEIKELKVGSRKVADGARSDTMMLIHISKKRDKAVIISIPRDTYAVIPAHISMDGKKSIPETPAKINAAFNWGGAPLLIKTLESMTNLRIDHYVEVSFLGFKSMVDALGGITVCSKVPINDTKSHLVMAAGVHRLDGLDALKYVRTRAFDGMGDLGRMQRQQQFVSAVFREATSSGVLLNPIKLNNLLKAVLKTVQTDSELNQGDLVTLAKQIRNLRPGKVRTLTVPLANTNYFTPAVGSAVLWDPELAPDLWNRLRKDLPVIDVIKNKTDKSIKKVDKFKTRTASENPCGSLK